MPVGQIELCSACDPQRKEGHGAVQASFLHLLMRFWKGWGGGKDHLSLWKQRKRQQKQNLNANETFSHLGQADFHINYFFFICPNTFPLLFGIQKPNDDNKSNLHVFKGNTEDEPTWFNYVSQHFDSRIFKQNWNVSDLMTCAHCVLCLLLCHHTVKKGRWGEKKI